MPPKQKNESKSDAKATKAKRATEGSQKVKPNTAASKAKAEKKLEELVKKNSLVYECDDAETESSEDETEDEVEEQEVEEEDIPDENEDEEEEAGTLEPPKLVRQNARVGVKGKKGKKPKRVTRKARQEQHKDDVEERIRKLLDSRVEDIEKKLKQSQSHAHSEAQVMNAFRRVNCAFPQ